MVAMKMASRKTFAAFAFLSALTFLSVFPSLASASNFDFVKSIRITSTANIVALDTFPASGFPGNDAAWFGLSSFSQGKSATTLSLQNNADDESYSLTFVSKNYGKLLVFGRSVTATIEIKNDANEDVACSDFGEERIFCSGGNLHVKITAVGYRWAGNIDSYTFEMNGMSGVDGSMLGFGNGTIIGYKDGVEVLRIGLADSKFAFSFFKNPDSATARFKLQNGNAEWINEPVGKIVDTTNVEWSFDDFAQTSNGGSGSIHESTGFSGSVSINLQGTLTTANGIYAVRNEIYVNLDKKHYSDCPIFTDTHVLCYVRSGYIHTYIPGNKDSTFWKAYPKIFVFEVVDGKATLSAGENSVDDVFKISNIDVIDFKFA